MNIDDSGILKYTVVEGIALLNIAFLIGNLYFGFRLSDTNRDASQIMT